MMMKYLGCQQFSKEDRCSVDFSSSHLIHNNIEGAVSSEVATGFGWKTRGSIWGDMSRTMSEEGGGGKSADKHRLLKVPKAR